MKKLITSLVVLFSLVVIGCNQHGNHSQQRSIQQDICPVSGRPLGSMGPPYRAANGVWLCCRGCESKLRR